MSVTMGTEHRMGARNLGSMVARRRQADRIGVSGVIRDRSRNVSRNRNIGRSSSSIGRSIGRNRARNRNISLERVDLFSTNILIYKGEVM